MVIGHGGDGGVDSHQPAISCVCSDFDYDLGAHPVLAFKLERLST